MINSNLEVRKLTHSYVHRAYSAMLHRCIRGLVSYHSHKGLMIRGVFLFFCFMVLSCKSLGSETEKFTDKKYESMREHFANIGKCTSIWKSEIKKWQHINGENFESIISVREAIANDNTSLFSLLVREVWSYQRKAKNAENIDNIGRWPVSSDEFRRATPLLFITKFDSIPEDCMATVWLEPQILGLFSIGGQKSALNMIEPYSEKWATYWIFVNLEQ
ncbi:hypothetical protein [Pseudoalteromonas sp. R3]|uniref:hypothetical protein n=1 Tax=Pseudoalteromonas sp. R3 TaxID=1709477 RepID=UPI000FDD96C7|nr:hypothetical protein [Pseudoalteromonas sp. R3]AZZ96617.1 hypothetical protein ELR70_05240 [Pseudoalteromonas sp. R3]